MRKISLKRLLVAALFSLLIGVMFVGCGKEETQEDEYEEDADEEEKKEKKKKKKDREEKYIYWTEKMNKNDKIVNNKINKV